MIDAHNHLQDRLLAPHLPGILEVLADLGFPQMIVNGTTIDDWGAVHRLAQQHRFVIPSYGLHPWYLDQRPADWEQSLRDHLENDPRACIGEVGVDHWMRDPDEEVQQTVLQRHLALAREYERPITIHCLHAWQPLTQALRESPPPSCGFLLHAFGGSHELMKQLTDLGAYFSFNPSFLHPNRTKKRAVYAEVPVDRLLVETDAPAMPPPTDLTRYPLPHEPDQPPLSHPGNLALAYEGLAEIRQIDPLHLEHIVQENFLRFTRPLAAPAWSR